MIGWIGLGLLMLAYLALVTRWSKFFIPIDAVASFLLTIHASMIGDMVFVIVNGCKELLFCSRNKNHKI